MFLNNNLVDKDFFENMVHLKIEANFNFFYSIFVHRSRAFCSCSSDSYSSLPDLTDVSSVCKQTIVNKDEFF